MSTPSSWVSLALDGVRLRVRVPLLALLFAFGCGEAGKTPRGESAAVSPNPPATAAPTVVIAPTAAVVDTVPTPFPPDPIILPSQPTISPPQPLPLNACTALTGDPDAPMSRFVVRHSDAPARVLYSWTSTEQIAELRATPTLLTRSISSDGEVGRAQGLIAAGSDPVSLLLNEERFANKRYAWTNPWATRLGWTGEDYGDRLLAIRLRPDAWVGQMFMDDSAGLSWAFRDMDGNSVTQAEVLEQPERLAAVYFFDSRSMPECRFERVTQGQLYREYFILNEAMVESWSAFTEEIKQELDSGVASLRRLLDTLSANECDAMDTCWRDGVLETWQSGPADGIVQSYLGGLAFPNDLYAPTRANIARLVERLEAVPFEAEPLEHAVALDVSPDAGASPLLDGASDAQDDAGAANANGVETDAGNFDMSGAASEAEVGATAAP